MEFTEENRKKLKAVAKPLMDWLRDNCPPNVTVTITGESAELFQGVVGVYADRTEQDSNTQG